MPEEQQLPPPRVLVVDESPAYIRMLQLELRAEGFVVEGCQIQHTFETIEQTKPVAIVLDVQLPAASGLTLLEELLTRHPQIPVLVATSMSTDADRALVLDMGATDFITKPFDPAELTLRLNTAMRRPSLDVLRKIQIGSLEIDIAHRIVRKGGNVVSLTVNEWALLLTLLDAEGPVSAEKLLVSVFEEEMLEHPSIVTHWVNRLRQHLEDDPNRPHYVLGDTVNGFALRRD